MYLPLHSDEGGGKPTLTGTDRTRRQRWMLLRLPYKKLAVVTVSLPLGAFALCVLISVIKDFESATFTHCHVLNVLPSVSAAIGSFYPQNLIWMFAIAAHALPRYLTAYLYLGYFRSVLRERVHRVAYLACALHVVEITTLVGLSFWNSSDHYPVHKTCFITFVATSEIYMLMSCILIRRHKQTVSTDLERKSLKWKWYMLIVNVLCFMAAGYFFMRHNTYCEPLVYSMFAASEYIVILTNMGFHMTACCDFAGKEILLMNGEITIR